MGMPIRRPRRLRATSGMRDLVRETHVRPSDLVEPLFVIEGSGVREEIPSMPGIYRVSPDCLGPELDGISAAGIPAVILFGVPRDKDPEGSGAWAADGIVQSALRTAKASHPDLVLMADLCLCEYTSHGHCGVIEGDDVANDPTLDLLAKTAISQAQAGADVIAPSDMMDGRVGHIREALDGAGFQSVPILSYAAKYASAFYGPFRDAAESAPAFGDRRSYQMDPSNLREALKEVLLDVEEGADAIMVKPALPYLDVVRMVRDEIPDLPIAAYNVSGEYSMIKAAERAGWLDGERAMVESLTSIKRAGADMILTYFARAFCALPEERRHS